MAQRQQLYESQKEISDEIAIILTKLESSSVRSSTINQYQKKIESLEAKFKSNDYKLLKLGKTSEDYFEKNYFEMVTEMIDRCKIAMLREIQVPEEDTSLKTRGEIKAMIQQLLDAHRTEKKFSQFEQESENYSSKVKEIPEEKIKTNWLIHFRKEIQKLEESCLNDGEANIFILELKKSVWEKKMLNIKSRNYIPLRLTYFRSNYANFDPIRRMRSEFNNFYTYIDFTDPDGVKNNLLNALTL